MNGVGPEPPTHGLAHRAHRSPARLRAVPTDLRTLDVVAAVVVALATLRGLWIGAVREAFSLAGLAVAAYAVRRWRLPAAAWLDAHGPFPVTELAGEILAVVLLVLTSVIAVGIVGRLVRRGVRGAGLGLMDRLAGALLGSAEGALVIAALVVGLSALLGHEDAALAGTKSLAALEWVERGLGIATPPRPPPSVAAGPEARREGVRPKAPPRARARE